MTISESARYAVGVALVVVVAALLFGQALGQPVLLGYTETGSMSPTLDAGDGFVAIPSALTGPPEAGDVVVFRAEELHGGGLTTHRVVERTPEGYITRGDANPFTDQDNAEPPVSESQIVAEALQLQGNVVVVPGLGSGVQAITGVVTTVLGFFAGLSGLQSAFRGVSAPMILVLTGGGLVTLSVLMDVFGSNRPAGTRSRRRPNYLSARLVMVVLVLLLVGPATVSMTVGSGTTTVDIVSSHAPSESPLVVAAGESTTLDYRLTNVGYVPTLFVLESGHPDASFEQSVISLPAKSSATTTLTIRAPDETGAYSRDLTEYRYLPLLPRSLILSLHEIHPLAALVAIDAVLVVAALAIGVTTLGVSPVRLRRSDRNLSVVERLKRRFL